MSSSGSGMNETQEVCKVEEQLLSKVGVQAWRLNLYALRAAANEIWSPDAPRVIKDYTDHGFAHSLRVLHWASKILDASRGSPLSPDEAYVLLAGIYLHDIGMQCDVVRLPEITVRAKELGADFTLSFTAQSSNSFTFQEQKAIRLNHQYLSTAWIEYAFLTGKTCLGAAAKQIPSEFVPDVMNACLYHSKLPITSCPEGYRFNPTQRMRLVAAILRFADELDVEANRVSLETAKNFRIEPVNAAYWWLHARTQIVFCSPHLVLLTVRLNREDFRSAGDIVRNTYVTGFQTKNHSVLSVLAQHGIPVLISADSGVVEDRYAEPLPDSILQALQALITERGFSESAVLRDISVLLSRPTGGDPALAVERAHEALELWRTILNVDYAAFLCGRKEGDVILRLRSSAGILPAFLMKGRSRYDWRKSGFPTGETSGGQLNWLSVSLADRERLAAAFTNAEAADVLSVSSAIVPVSAGDGFLGLLMIGNPSLPKEVPLRESALLDVSREICTRLLYFELGLLHGREKEDWTKSAHFMGHRIRAALQGVHSQLRILEAVRGGVEGFDASDAAEAATRLRNITSALVESSYAAALVPFDVAAVHREFVPLDEAIHAAMVQVNDIAIARGVHLEASPDLSDLPLVHVSVDLITRAFVNLLGVAITLSRPRLPDGERTVTVGVKKTKHESDDVTTVVVRFYAVSDVDLARMFEWGYPFPAGGFTVDQGMGLWEVAHIIRGHGGTVSVARVDCTVMKPRMQDLDHCEIDFYVAIPCSAGQQGRS